MRVSLLNDSVYSVTDASVMPEKTDIADVRALASQISRKHQQAGIRYRRILALIFRS